MSRGSMWILTIHRIWLGFLKSDLCSGYGLGRLRWSYWQAVRLICSAMTLRAGPVRVCQAGIRTMMEQPAYVCLILAAAAQRRVTQAKAARTRVPTVRAAQRAKPAEAREQPARRCQPADRRPQAVLSGPEVSPARCSRPAAVSRVAQPLQAAVPRRVAALLRVASPEASRARRSQRVVSRVAQPPQAAPAQRAAALLRAAASPEAFPVRRPAALLQRVAASQRAALSEPEEIPVR